MVSIISVLFAADNPLSFIDYIAKGGFVVLLLVILYGGYKENPWWVFGREHRACVQREAEWKGIAMKSTHMAESAASVGEHLAERNKALREGEGSA